MSSDQPDFVLLQITRDERIVLRKAFGNVFWRVQRGVDFAAQLAGGAFKRAKNVGITQCAADDQHVDA